MLPEARFTPVSRNKNNELTKSPHLPLVFKMTKQMNSTYNRFQLFFNRSKRALRFHADRNNRKNRAFRAFLARILQDPIKSDRHLINDVIAC